MLSSKTYLVLLGAIAVGAASPSGTAQAQTSGSQSITLNGTAVPVCSLPAPVAGGAAANATFSSNTISVTQFIDPTTALVVPATFSLQFANTICNSNASLSLLSKNGGMTQQNGSANTATPGAFLQTVPYTATATWGGVNVSLDTGQARSASTPVPGANSGTLVLVFQTQASTLPVVQGSYQDFITVKLAATP